LLIGVDGIWVLCGGNNLPNLTGSHSFDGVVISDLKNVGVVAMASLFVFG
jgi:hypothetical protein